MGIAATRITRTHPTLEMASDSVANKRALSKGRAASRLLHSAFAAHHAITQQEGVHVGIGQPRADTFGGHV